MSLVSKFISNIIRENKKKLIWIITIATFGSILAVFVPYIYGRLFDLAVIPQTNSNLLFSLIGLWIFLSLISSYTSYKSSYLGELLGQKIALEEESKAYYHFITLPISFHKKKRKGEILNKLSRGSWNIAMFVQNLSRVLPQFLVLIFAIIFMLIVKWELALILVFSFFIYSFLTIKSIKPILKVENKLNEVFEKQYGIVYDKLSNINLIKNFSNERKEKLKIHSAIVLKPLPFLKKSSKKWTKLSFHQRIIYDLSFVFILSVAILFLKNRTISAGEFIMFFGYINLSFGPFWNLTNLYRLFKQSGVAIKRFIKLKQLVPEEMKHGNLVLKDLKGDIKIENLSFGYKKNRLVLEDLNLNIKRGETIAFVGKSGVGKTTLSELLMGYYKPLKGKIFLDNKDISKLKLGWLRDQIALVPQDISLFHDTLVNNLRYANPDATKKEIISAAKQASAHDFIMNFPKKYETIVGEKGVKLSVGQRQRIALTMAFLKKPKILILDEPTAALDSESEKKVEQGIHKLIKGRTTLIIAHRFSTVRNADKIAVLNKGKIAEIGNHRELMNKKGLYHKFYGLQMGLE